MPLVIISIILFLTIQKGGKLVKSFFMSSTQQRELDFFYSQRISYYKSLSQKQRSRFLYRVFNLSNEIKIIGRKGFEITNEVRLIVLAAFVQITFGFKNYNLPKFKTVLVYPESYQNPFTGRMHDGEVNPRGAIVLTWSKLAKGYANDSDSINLGLHELAHALMLVINDESFCEDGVDAEMKRFVEISKVEIERLQSGQRSIFRNYAGTNTSEFFAVAVEHFFENPQELMEANPALYRSLMRLLKQDLVKIQPTG